MIKLVSASIAAALALGTSLPALAAGEATATLRLQQGTAMTSQGGEFTIARTGQVLVVGERLMLAENSTATVAYANDCTREYTAPGVYVIEASCQKAAAAGTDWASAGKIVAGSAVIAAILSQDQVDAEPPPVSR